MTARLPERLIDQLWVRMGLMFGHAWASQYGDRADGVAGDTWASALAGLNSEQLANGLREVVVLGDKFPPSAPMFRALCLGIPTLATVKQQLLKRDAEHTPFARLVASKIDWFRFTRSDADTSDRMLREAYEAGREHVMRGGDMPESPAALIEHERNTEAPKPADPAKVREFMTRIEAALGRDPDPNDEFIKPKTLDEIAAEMRQEVACNPHPDAPHGFDRNASHSLNRYVCDCEGWSPGQ